MPRWVTWLYRRLVPVPAPAVVLECGCLEDED